MGFSTKAIHAAIEPDPTYGSIMTPVHLTSTYVQQELGVNKGFEYARVSNPTRTVLEKNIAASRKGTATPAANIPMITAPTQALPKAPT